MELTIDSIYQQEDPYQAFLDSVKNKETLRKYKNHLHRFLISVPKSLYQSHLGYLPESDESEVLAMHYLYPREQTSKDMAYTREELQKMLEKNYGPSLAEALMDFDKCIRICTDIEEKLDNVEKREIEQGYAEDWCAHYMAKEWLNCRH